MLSALVQSKFDSYPPHVQQVLLSARQLILQVAKEQNISSVEESLKWGQLSYSAKHASTVRIDWSDKTPQQFYFYFICSTCLVPESVTSMHHIAQALDYTAVRKMPAEPTGFMHGCIYLANAGRI